MFHGPDKWVVTRTRITESLFQPWSPATPVEFPYVSSASIAHRVILGNWIVKIHKSQQFTNFGSNARSRWQVPGIINGWRDGLNHFSIMTFARALSIFVLALPVLAAARVLSRTDKCDIPNTSLMCCGGFISTSRRGGMSLPRSMLPTELIFFS